MSAAVDIISHQIEMARNFVTHLVLVGQGRHGPAAMHQQLAAWHAAHLSEDMDRLVAPTVDKSARGDAFPPSRISGQVLSSLSAEEWAYLTRAASSGKLGLVDAAEVARVRRYLATR